jgi:hypothetical protein
MKNILLVVPARQKDEIFKLHLESLNNLKVPEGVSLKRLFILHNSPNLTKLIPNDDNTTIQQIKTEDIYTTDEDTHYWKHDNLAFITALKNGIFDYVRKSQNEYVFIVDSDLVLHPDTLINLYNAKKEIVSEIFWTKWNKQDTVAMPNAWDLDHYSFLPDTLETYKQKGLYECGGTGACILIHRSVIDRNVSYNPITNLSFWGEDRAFSIRAKCAGFSLWVDTNSPAFHIYRDSDIEEGRKVLEGYKNG